jgi:DNA-binding LacI/PurR family transcriptional regulator
MSSTAPSLRELARILGLSHTTVSEALRGSPRVKPATRKLVLEKAREVGYRRNPLAGALMSEMRRSRAGTFRGVLAVLDLDGPVGRPASAARYHRELTRGAAERAQELGFSAETFAMGQKGMSMERLDGILHARGIRGVFLLPVREPPDFTRLDWTHFAGVYADYVIERPALHAVAPDHYRAMFMALQRLQGLGYRRPGFAIGEAHDARLLYKWQAAFHAFATHHGELQTVPPLIAADLTQARLTAWCQAHRPDVVLCHNSDVLVWLQAAGFEVPRETGFCCLNVTQADVPCAGLDLQPRLLGARGMELLVAQVLRNEQGVPDVPSTTTVPAAWVDGPTLRGLPSEVAGRAARRR